MLSPISVLMTSTSYPQGPKDWKSVFIRQLLNALSENSQVQMKYWGPPGEVPENSIYACLTDESVWLNKIMDQGGIIHMLRQKGSGRFAATLKLMFLLRRAYKRHGDVSLYHVNWLQNALPLWGTDKPALVTVLGSDFGLLNLPGMTSWLRRIFKSRRCVLAPNAEWMKFELQKRFGDVAQIIPIPLGINNDWFTVDRTAISFNKCKWLVVSRLTSKKIGTLFDWGKDIFPDSSKHELHLFGPMQEKIIIPEWVHYHGATHPRALSQDWFPRATGLITLSQHDEGRPQVILEAMAAGVPIIASNLPAHKNIVVHKKTGILVESPKQFALAVEWLSEPNNNQQISTEARNLVRHEIGTWSDCAKRYIEAYRILLDGTD